MKILLDTHFLIWSISDISKLSENEKDIILSEQTEILVSSVSLWEISLKYSLKNISFKNIMIDDIINAIYDSGYNLINLDAKESISFYRLPVIKHKDPFDRMLVWQSIMNNYYFMTRDKNLNEYINIGLRLIET